MKATSGLRYDEIRSIAYLGDGTSNNTELETSSVSGTAPIRVRQGKHAVEVKQRRSPSPNDQIADFRAFWQWHTQQVRYLEEQLAKQAEEIKRYQDLLAKDAQALWAEWDELHRPRVDASNLQVESAHVAAITWMKRVAQLSDDQIAEYLGVSRQAIHSWRQGTPIKATNRRRVLSLRDVFERASNRLGSLADLATWLSSPALPDGRSPHLLLTQGSTDQVRALANNAIPVRNMVAAGPSTSKQPWTERQEALAASYDDNIPGWTDEEG